MNKSTIHDYYEEFVKQENDNGTIRLPEITANKEQKRYQLRLQISLAAIFAAALTGMLLLPLPRIGLTEYRKSTERFDLNTFHNVLAATSRSLTGELAYQRSLP